MIVRNRLFWASRQPHQDSRQFSLIDGVVNRLAAPTIANPPRRLTADSTTTRPYWLFSQELFLADAVDLTAPGRRSLSVLCTECVDLRSRRIDGFMVLGR